MMRRCVPLLACLLAACSLRSAPAANLAPTPQTEYPALLAQASQEASAGRFNTADRLLTDFSAHYPASGEAVESMYWRALYKLDPSNANGSMREAAVLLDSYLTSANAAHRAEALTMRRIVTAVEARAAARTEVGPKPVADAPVADKAKDDEIARLKDELAKTTAELDRIKKRLAQPTKP